MLTDDDARRLLQRAGETVDVQPAAPVEDRPRRPMWPVLVGAAAVLVIAVISVLATTGGGPSNPEPAPPVADKVHVPSVLGYREADARDLLQQAGLQVTLKLVPACTTYGPALGTEPAAGTPVTAGESVLLEIAANTENADCFFAYDDLPWQLLAFAEGRPARLALADDVQAWQGDTPTDSAAVLGRLAAVARAFYPTSHAGTYLSPSLEGWTGPLPGQRGGPFLNCNYKGGPAFADRSFVRVGVSPSGGDDTCPEFVIDVYRTDEAVDALVLRTLYEEAAPGTGPDPKIGTAFRAFARGGDLPPMADQVDLYLGNAFTGYVTNQSASDRRAWATCTELGSYAARTCPLSPLEVLQDHPQVEYVERPRGLCMPTYGPVPPDLRELDRVTIVPANGSIDSCIQNFAVQLFVDDGDLVAVSLLLGEP